MSHWLCKCSAASRALDFTPAQSMASWAGGPGVQSAPSSAATVCRLMARSTGDCSRRWAWRNRRDDNRSLLVASGRRRDRFKELRLGVNLSVLFNELACFLFQSDLQRLLLRNFLFGGEFAYVLGDLHRAKMRAAHGTSSFTKAMAR